MRQQNLENSSQSAQRAQQNMQRARESLKKQQPGSAQGEEEEAKRDLERAREEIERKLEELKREAEEELRVHIETELRKIIEEQKKVNAATLKYDGVRVAKGTFTRQEGVEVRQLGLAQDGLSSVCGELVKKLQEENVEVYKFVLISVIDDMGESSSRLRDINPGARTQEIQEDIIRKLTDLYDAFNIKRRQGKGGGGQGQQGKPPLVPDIVQLNLMKKIQEQILKKTQKYQARHPKQGEDLPEQDRRTLKRLSDEQGELSRILGKFIEKFKEAAQERQKEE